ncbi:putative polygalacturonase [Citrus sinensis]|nr:putative polygalacturonase [Citrus sinensis]
MAIWGSSFQPREAFPSYASSVSVIQFGAVGDGETDDSQAFLKAWKSICGSKSNAPPLLVPAGKTFLLNPVSFQGPCKSSSINVQIQGNIVAPHSSAWDGHDKKKWLLFSNVNGLTVNGNGKIDGKGASWWSNKQHQRPTALSFGSCNNLVFRGLMHVDSPGNHISVYGCNDVSISNLKIIAPESSPNTDGIDITHSSNVQIRDCTIATGDDCVAIGTDTSNIAVTGVICGPGHGISIGSLGANGGTSIVEDVHVRDCTFKGTKNGARIKTWQGGSGHARRISFERIKLESSDNPIIIDQYYCGPNDECKNQTSAVKVSDVSYIGFQGTSSTEEAVQLSCSESVGCTDIKINDIDITHSDSGKDTRASCINAHGELYGRLVPSVDCLLP